MKILSWNVNGLRSVTSRGFEENIKKLNDDIICLQEIKVIRKLKNLKLEKYYSYYNYPTQSGFAGVAIFTKIKPDKVYYGMELKNENVDKESRVITLEYSNFFIVSVYVPRSRTKNARISYRIEFDKYFREYIKRLNKIKNVIICGDFNTCFEDIDILEKKENRKIGIFFDEERNGFKRFLEIGLIDTFRYLYPNKRQFTFRASKLFDEEKRYGWRLDYILVSNFIKNKIREAKILNEIEGSDHCPIELEIEIEPRKELKKYNYEKAKNNLFEMQCKLTKATFNNDNKKRIKLQEKIVLSKEAKMLATKKALEITREKNKIEKQAIYNKTMQELYAYSLEPVAEARADRKSFGFRKQRSNVQAHLYVAKAMLEKQVPQWVLTSKIEYGYEKILHKWAIRNIPMDKNALKKFIENGTILNEKIFKAKNDISNIIDNMMLDGLQQKLYSIQGNNIQDYYNGYCIRFADKVLIFARSRSEAEILKKELSNFAAIRGLQLNEEETKILNIQEGFEFLSRDYYKVYGGIKCVPAKTAVDKFEKEIEEIIYSSANQGAQSTLIQNINTKIEEFINYHKYEEAKEEFKHLDIMINLNLFRAMTQVHNTLTREQIVKKFWKKDKKDRYVFTLLSDKKQHVQNMEDTLLVVEPMIDIKKNIYLDAEYFKR